MHLDGLDQTALNMVRQEKEKEKQGAAAGTGEDLCRPSVYNRRLQATQSPKYGKG